MMDEFERVASRMAARISDIRNGLNLVKASLFFLRHKGEVFAFERIPGHLRSDFQQIVGLKDLSENSANCGLYLQVYGAFERYVSDLVEAFFERKRTQQIRYSQFGEGVRNAHAVGSAKLLSRMHEGNINGVKFDFPAFQKNLGFCFTDDDKYRIDASSFTALLGVCTPEKIDRLFQDIGVGCVFDDALGRNKGLKSWGSNGGAREVTKLARDALSALVRKRNQIAHGATDPVILETDIEESMRFVDLLSIALMEKLKAAV